jgi:hypothetical protein
MLWPDEVATSIHTGKLRGQGVPRAAKWRLRCHCQTGGWEIKRALTQKGRCGARTMELVLANQGKDAQTLGIAAQLLQRHCNNA